MKAIFLILALALPLVLAACPTDTKPPNPPKNLPPIIPETTKVADPATRTALSSYDAASGTMRYAQSTPVIANLKTDDVIVSEPSSAAPNGYLRKVKAIRKEGNAVVLETTQANLTDAVSQGTLEANGTLTAKDVKSTKVFFKGVSINAGGTRIRPTVGVGENFSFKLNFNQVFIPLTDPDGNASGQIAVDGSIEYNAGYGVHVGIEACFDLPPVCVNSFETKIGFDQQASLHISGDLKGQLGKEIKVGEQYFEPIKFFIGPVPVVIIPHVDIFLSVSGQVTARFDFQASENAVAQLGARWTPGDGWKNITGFDFTGGAPAPTLTGTLKPKAGLRSSFSFLLYGLAGPEASLTGGLELDGQVPRNPIWIVNGFLKGTLGFVVELPIIGKLVDYQTTLFDKSLEFARSGNTRPTLELTANAKPDPNLIIKGTPRTAPLGVPINFENGCGIFPGFYFNAIDLEDGCAIGVTVVSSVDGTLPQKYTFQNQGLREITVTARDSQGLSSASKFFTLNVVNSPPVAYGSIGTDTTQATVPLFFSLAALDPNSGRLGCDAITVSGGPIQVVSAQDGDCRYQVTFNDQGQQTLTATARDPQGALSSPKSFPVFVTAAPLVPPPVWAIPPGLEVRKQVDNSLVPNEGKLVCFENVVLTARATDPNGRPVTYAWTKTQDGQPSNALNPDPDGKVRTSSFGRTRFSVVASNDGPASNNPLSQTVIWPSSPECPR